MLLRFIALFTVSRAEMSKLSYSYLGIIWMLCTFRFLSSYDEDDDDDDDD